MNQKDIFKEQLKSAFSDFEAPVPPDGWERLEQSLNTVARAKIVRRNWYIGSAAATVAILLGSLFFLRTPKTLEQNIPAFTEDIASQKRESVDKQDVQLETPKSPGKTDKVSKPSLAGKKQDVLLAKTTESKEIPPSTASEKTVIAEQVPEKEALPTKDKPKEQPNQEELDRLVREFAQAGERDIFSELETKRSKNNPLMLAMNAKGGLASSQKTVVNSPMTLRSASVAEKSDDNKLGDGFYSGGITNNLSSGYENVALRNSQSTADNVAEMEHDQPISLGITVSKNIIDRLSVETGLVYTYLFSRAKNTNVNFQNKETQHFHYLGIPLNFNYNFVDIGKLGIFASLGGMVEKDVYGKRQYQAQVTNESGMHVGEEWAIQKISQNNPQFSVNAGVGVVYPIYGGFNLYGKIGGSYYFDANESYKTIYSDKKIILDLNAGIRFDF